MFPGNLNPVEFRLNSLLSLVHVIIFHDCYVIDHQVAPWRQNSPRWLEKCVLWQEHLGGLVKVLPWCWPRQEPLCILQVSLTFQEIVLWFDKSSVKGSSLKDAERCVLLEHFGHLQHCSLRWEVGGGGLVKVSLSWNCKLTYKFKFYRHDKNQHTYCPNYSDKYLYMALLNFSLSCFVLYCYAFVQYMWRQYNPMPCINLSEYWTTLKT